MYSLARDDVACTVLPESLFLTLAHEDQASTRQSRHPPAVLDFIQ